MHLMSSMVRATTFSLALSFCSTLYAQDSEGVHYQMNSIIAEELSVQNQHGDPQSLLNLIQAQGKKLSVLFIFGGGGMGDVKTEETGGLWCPDSYQDSEILRNLHTQYGDQIGFIPIAIPPAYHTHRLGFIERVFFDSETDSEDYQTAVKAFVDSTQSAYSSGTLPVQPYYDIGFNLLVSAEEKLKRQSIHPTISAWHGAFRAVNETQSYGVPNIWLVDEKGKIVSEPFRGNVYHPHGGEVSIQYSLADVVEQIESAL